jgi:hypothetical protein
MEEMSTNNKAIPCDMLGSEEETTGRNASRPLVRNKPNRICGDLSFGAVQLTDSVVFKQNTRGPEIE